LFFFFGAALILVEINMGAGRRPVRLAYQPEQTSHQQPSTFLSEQTSTSQTNRLRGGCVLLFIHSFTSTSL
jgi:hypothetical protein